MPSEVSPAARDYPDSDSIQRLNLEDLRQNLIRQEETIIFALIERSQFPANPEVYATGSHEGLLRNDTLPKELSFLDYMLRETERLHSLVRRFTSQEECAFFPKDLPHPILPLLQGPRVLFPNSINVNARVKALYLNCILPRICAPGSDSNTYGSTSVTDIAVLQAISKRIHFGKFIAESKFQEAPEKYTALIQANDTQGIMDLLTNVAVEERVLQRVEMKASLFGSDVQDTGPRPEVYKVPPAVIRELYRDLVIPLTKEVEVLYLLQRVNHKSVAIAGQALDNSNPAYQAAIKHFGSEISGCLLLCPGPPEVFQAVMQNEVCYGVILMEDSASGALRHHFLFDMFCTAKVMICDEIYLTLPAGEHNSPFMTSDKDRVLRYVVISKDQGVPVGNDKTAVCFGTTHESGGLRNCLDVLHSHSINLLSIQSHLLGSQPMIFVEFQGHSADPAVQAALTALQRQA
eukprot:EG_transcript_12179